jgi:hypothetical protein
MPLVRAVAGTAGVEAFLHVGRHADVQRLPANRIEAALDRPAVDMPALLLGIGQRKEAVRRVEGRIQHRLQHAMADQREEAVLTQRGVNLQRQRRIAGGRQIDKRDAHAVLSAWTPRNRLRRAAGGAPLGGSAEGAAGGVMEESSGP